MSTTYEITWRDEEEPWVIENIDNVERVGDGVFIEFRNSDNTVAAAIASAVVRAVRRK